MTVETIPVSQWSDHERDASEFLLESALGGLGVSRPFTFNEASLTLWAQIPPSDAELEEVNAWLRLPEHAERWLALHPEDKE